MMGINVAALKQHALESGADLIGVAPAERMQGAPAGHRPVDLFPAARSLVVCAKRIPEGAMAGPATSYQSAMDSVHQRLDVLACELALWLEDQGGKAMPVPSDEPYRYWDAERSYGRGDLSQRHAAQAAGLGRMGRNSLLITPQYGNRVHLVSVLTDLALAADPVLDWEPCPPKCSLCVEVCPAGAVGDGRVEQALCRPEVMEVLSKGTVVERCWACRQICPAGVKSNKRKNHD
jgi:epoxyqueuosine reductase QueG